MRIKYTHTLGVVSGGVTLKGHEYTYTIEYPLSKVGPMHFFFRANPFRVNTVFFFFFFFTRINLSLFGPARGWGVGHSRERRTTAASWQSTETEHVKHTHTTSPCHEAIAPGAGARAAPRRAPYTA